MLYIVGGAIGLYILFKLGINPIKFILFAILCYILWRLGVLGFVWRIIWGILKWILIRLLHLYYNLFGEEPETVMDVDAIDDWLDGFLIETV